MNTLPRERGIPALTDAEFERFRSLARSACGLSLQPSKKALVSSRLERVLRRNQWNSYGRLLDVLSARTSGPEWTEFIDVLTTNHTGFFREIEHFTFLQREVFPRVNGPLRIWSAACATGEEPYSIAICAIEAGVREFEIVATDISRGALGSAQLGVFDETRLGGLDSVLRERYMSPGTAVSGQKNWTVAPRIRRCIRFMPINLLHPLEHVGRFHVIFCRNVMIYFDREIQDGLVSRLVGRLHDGGVLFTGHSESLLHLPQDLEYVKPAVYRRPR